MFRFHKTKDVVSLFHKADSAPSMRVLALLKQASAQASETATVDQASDHSGQNEVQRTEFDLEVTEEPPTSDQVRSILEYTGQERAADLVEGATSIQDAIKKLKEDRNKFRRPVVVDWNNGKAVIGDNESAILKLVGEYPKAK